MIYLTLSISTLFYSTLSFFTLDVLISLFYCSVFCSCLSFCSPFVVAVTTTLFACHFPFFFVQYIHPKYILLILPLCRHHQMQLLPRQMVHPKMGLQKKKTVMRTVKMMMYRSPLGTSSLALLPFRTLHFVYSVLLKGTQKCTDCQAFSLAYYWIKHNL